MRRSGNPLLKHIRFSGRPIILSAWRNINRALFGTVNTGGQTARETEREKQREKTSKRERERKIQKSRRYRQRRRMIERRGEGTAGRQCQAAGGVGDDDRLGRGRETRKQRVNM